MRFACIPTNPAAPGIRGVIGIQLFLAKRSDGKLLQAMRETRVFEAGMGKVGMRGATDTEPCAMCPDVISTTGHMRPGAMTSAGAPMPSGDSAVIPAAAAVPSGDSAAAMTAAAAAAMTAAAAAAMTAAATAAAMASAAATTAASTTAAATTTTTATCRTGQGDSGSG